MPIDIDEAIRAIVGARSVRVDVGDVNGRPFINNAASDFVGNIEYQLSGLELGGRTKLDAGWLQVCMAPGMQRRRVAFDGEVIALDHPVRFRIRPRVLPGIVP